MKRHLLTLLIIYSVLLFAGWKSVHAQERFADRYNITYVTMNEGLPHNFIDDLYRDIPKIIKFKATNSLRVSCLFCIFKHSPQKTV